MENLTDSQLMRLYLEGNHKAFEGIIARYSGMVYRFVFKILNNQEEAHDVTQESFIAVWKHIKKFDLNRNFKVWLFAVARNKLMDVLRKRKSVTFSSLTPEDSDTSFESTIPDEELLPNEVFERNETIELMRSGLEKIAVDDKTIILLHHGEDMTFEEIAEIMKKPMNTVKSRYRRALYTLKKYISEHDAPK